MDGAPNTFTIRDQAGPNDIGVVKRLVESTGLFSPAEIGVAVELVEERLSKGPASGYEFLFAEAGGEVLGYACYGHIAVTQSSYDLYWIVVDKSQQGRGLGRRLLAAAEERIAAAGGGRVYIETSGRADYQQTQRFYGRCGYTLEARMKEFYGPGDDKLVYVRQMRPRISSASAP
jgi:ribosomal protein S18 acetylase RimI-like enzyme